MRANTPDYDQAVNNGEDRWVAACGGHEQPYVYRHRTYLYVYNPAIGQHGYYDLATDIVYEKLPE